jgi:hypothetical protein
MSRFAGRLEKNAAPARECSAGGEALAPAFAKASAGNQSVEAFGGDGWLFDIVRCERPCGVYAACLIRRTSGGTASSASAASAASSGSTC